MLVEDLLKNNYLITPSAYYLLEPYYQKNFTLAELIKFTKSMGSFVITLTVAEEFLRFKGLISSGNKISAAGETVVNGNGEIVDAVCVSLNSGESLESSADSGAVHIGSSTGALGSVDPPQSGESHVSTGAPGLEKGYETSFGSDSSKLSHFSGGRSLVSTGTATPSTEVEAAGTLEKPSEEGLSIESFPLENGSDGNISEHGGVGVAVDDTIGSAPDENSYLDENRNGIKPKLVYGNYGISIAHVDEDIPEEEKTYSVYEDVVISPKPGFHYRAAELTDESEVVFDVKDVKFSPPKAKNASGKEGEFLVEAYRLHFRSRLKKMKRIFRENPEVGGIIDIGKLSYVQPGTEVTVVGLVNEKRESSKGYILEIEDATGRVKVFVSRNREDAKLVMNIMHDSAIAVSGKYSGRGMVFADRIYLPDVPRLRHPKQPLEEKVYAVLLSDIHIGSNKFCEKAFEKFLEWLNGNVENKAHAELVSRIKYLIIAGDVVDGVGIYPGQYEELTIPDIFDQYEAVVNLLRNVPRHIHMFIGPGNHDAARTALPQPGFYEEYAKPLYRLKNATIISNPAVIRLHGRDFLIAHGRGIEDVVTEIPNRSHHRPAEAMVELLKLRHLAPTFSGKVPIAPDPEDLLVIESVPDLFQAGHVHVMEYRIYNGVFVINTGTWQAQTEFQKMVNIVPTPARVPIIDVETARLRAVVSFEQFCGGFECLRNCTHPR